MSSISSKKILALSSVPLVLILLSIISVHLLTKTSEHGIVHFDNAKVFSEFNLSKELNTLGMQQIQPQKKKVDSLVSLLQKQGDINNTEEIQQLFIAENTKLKKMSETIYSQTNFKIWSRINDYAKDYGEDNAYEIILGTTGNGNLMYANKSLDVTDDFIAYANKKYEGE